MLHVALRAPAGRVDRGRRRERRARGPRRARPDGRLRRPRPQRRLDGPHRQAHPQRRQHRHRRLRPRPGDGLRGAAALQRPRPDLPLRLERRRHRLRRGHPRPRPGRDAVHRLLEDVHHAGDDDQRPHAPATGAWRALGDEQAVAKHFVAVSTNADGGREVRHRHRQHVRLLGLGRRPLLDGLGDRPVDDDRHRPGPLPRDARRLPRDGRALPHRAVRAEPAGADGAARRLVQRLLRRPDRRGAAVRPVPRSASRPTCSSSTMESNGKHVTLDGDARSTTRPARSTGASRAPTASTRSTS